MMNNFKPSPRYRVRLYVLITMVGIFLLGFGILLAWILSADWAYAVHINQALQAFIASIFLGYLLSLWIAHRYYLSMDYVFNTEEIQIRRGIWERSIQHIPLQNIAEITVKRDFIDRGLEIGTLEFMLACLPNHKISIASLVGLSDVDAQYLKFSDLLLHYGERTRQQPDAGVLESNSVLGNSPIDLR